MPLHKELKPSSKQNLNTTIKSQNDSDSHIHFQISGFFKLWQIIGDNKRNISPIIPVSRSTFLAKVKSKEWPQPVHLGARSIAWRVVDIKELIEKLESNINSTQYRSTIN